MMETLIGLGLKSFLVAAVTLGLLHLTRRRSAADRSWIAHLGLFALVALPLATLALPSLSIECPPRCRPNRPPPLARDAPRRAGRGPDRHRGASAGRRRPVIRLDALRLRGPSHRTAARDAHRLAAPVRAARPRPGAGRPGVAERARPCPAPHGVQERHRLAHQLELSSPISWGLMRPVILLNDEALGASDEAEAIIAHELAHVARLDWAKLMLARVATAIFWFNPLAWALAREAHQLREEPPMTPCSAPTSPIPITPNCWSGSRATNAAGCCSARMAFRRARDRSPAASAACSIPACRAPRAAVPGSQASPPACWSWPRRSPR